MTSAKDVYILISKICEYVTLCGERNFAGVIKLRILRRDYPRPSTRSQSDHKPPYKKEETGSKDSPPQASGEE